MITLVVIAGLGAADLGAAGLDGLLVPCGFAGLLPAGLLPGAATSWRAGRFWLSGDFLSAGFLSPSGRRGRPEDGLVLRPRGASARADLGKLIAVVLYSPGAIPSSVQLPIFTRTSRRVG